MFQQIIEMLATKKERWRPRNMAGIVCYKCGQTGHIQRNCGSNGSDGANRGTPYNPKTSASNAGAKAPAAADSQTPAAPDTRTPAAQDAKAPTFKNAKTPVKQSEVLLNK